MTTEPNAVDNLDASGAVLGPRDRCYFIVLLTDNSGCRLPMDLLIRLDNVIVTRPSCYQEASFIRSDPCTACFVWSFFCAVLDCDSFRHCSQTP